MSFFLSYGAEKLASSIAAQKRRHQQKQQSNNSTHEGDGSSMPVADQWEEIIYQLKHNKLVELRLGWHDSAHVPGIRSLSSSLAKALRENTSLRRVSIGWNWQKRQDVLVYLLVTLAESIRPHQLQSIHLVLTNDCIPANVLAKFLQSQVSLSSLNLQTMSVHNNSGSFHHNKRSDMTASARSSGSTTLFSATESSSLRSSPNSGSSKRSSKTNDSNNFSQRVYKDRHSLFKPSVPNQTTVVPVVLSAHGPNSHNYHCLSELRLVDCDLKDDDIVHLANEIIPTTFLSVRGNRFMTGEGAAALIRAEKASSLDLSLCNFDPHDFQIMATALQELSTPLQQLLLRGNYRMGLEGLEHVFRVCPFVVQSLDLSYCDLSEDMTIYIFQTLVEIGQKTLLTNRSITTNSSSSGWRSEGTELQHLEVHGCRIRGTNATDLLVALLRQNVPPLRSLGVDDDKNDRKYLSASQMRDIANAMPENYEMEHLSFDFFKNREEQRLWKEIEFWQVLNRAGRRLLRPAIPQTPLECSRSSTSSRRSPSGRDHDGAMAKALRDDLNSWIRLLDAAKAEAGLDSLFWVVLNSAERFRRI